MLAFLAICLFQWHQGNISAFHSRNMKTIKTSLTLSQQLLEITLFKTPIIYPSLRTTSFKIWTFWRSFLYIWNDSNESIYIIFIIYIIMSQTFIKIDSLSATPWNFKTNLSCEPVKNPWYNIHGLTLSANFSKLMWTIHICRTSTFQCENVQCFTFKRCDKFKIKVLVMEVCIVRIILEKFT